MPVLPLINRIWKRYADTINSRIISKDKWFSPSRTWYSFLIIVSLVGFIIIWQLFFVRKSDLNSDIGLNSASGVHDQALFSYGLYYWGLFPAYPLRSVLPEEFQSDDLFYSREGADRIMEEYGSSLRMESRHTILYGELGKNYLPYFHALIQGSPKNVSFKPANAAFFILSLVLLLVVFWRMGKGIMGIILCLILGSYPFQIFEVYYNENVFGYYISMAILMTGLFLPFIFKKSLKLWIALVSCATAGIIFAALFTIRTEPLMVSGAVFLILLLHSERPFLQRAGLLVLLILVFLAGEFVFSSYFESKFREAAGIVAEKGGEVFKGRRAEHHVFWHSLWIGLGDFDDKYGILWADSYGLAYAKPILIQKYGKKVLKDLDHTSLYENPIFTHPDYGPIIRDKFIKGITHDPGWYLGILMKRILRIVKDSKNSRIWLFGWSVPTVIPGVFSFFVFIMLLFLKRWEYVKLMFFPLTTALVPLLVYSEGGMTSYFIGHLYLFSIALYVLLKTGVEPLRYLGKKIAIGIRTVAANKPVI
ncbi:MAG: hypothetical protein JXB26_18665 [Candidatus Aminicenantes bacterium]|nr:hypothetical protein [Candidatus Aminicenantes bacterium]